MLMKCDVRVRPKALEVLEARGEGAMKDTSQRGEFGRPRAFGLGFTMLVVWKLLVSNASL